MSELAKFALWELGLAGLLLILMQRIEIEGDYINQRTLILQIDAWMEREYHNQDDRKYARDIIKQSLLFYKQIELECYLISSDHQIETKHSPFSQPVFQKFHQRSVFPTGYH